MVNINTNLQSLIVQKNLTQSTNALNQAIERMTTGFKLNHASDNAANYSIAEDMNSKLSSYEVAEDNASMGLDMMQTAADSMSLITNHLNRIRDLAEQAANGTYGEQSMEAINSEVQARAAEINRIIANTEFNGIKLLEGEQTESNVTGKFLKPVEQLTEEEAVAQGYTVIKTKRDLDSIRYNMSGKYILMNDIDLEGSCLQMSVYDAPYNVFTGEFNGNGYVIKNFTKPVDVPTKSGFFLNCTGATIKNLGLENVYNVFNASYSTGGLLFCQGSDNTVTNVYVTGQVMGSFAGGLACNVEGGSFTDCYVDATVQHNGYGAGAIYCTGSTTCSNVYWNKDKTANPVNGSTTLAGATGVTTAELAALVIDPSEQGGEKAVNISLQVGVNGDSSSQIGVSLGGLGLSNFGISFTTHEEARNALSTIDGYLERINSKQTEYGAVYNRLESAIESIGVNIENLTSSLSTIRDADIATESSNYIKSQILQQASATLLATANQSPSIALQLL